jgi:hypothetical protein
VLGVLFYFVARAGLLSANADSVSPYGVVAFGALAGWFSKQATDKLAEVFETLFRTQKGPVYKDALGSTSSPKVTKIDPPSINRATMTGADLPIVMEGEGFVDGSWVLVDNQKVVATWSGKTLTFTIPALLLSTSSREIEIVVVNPLPPNAPSTTQRMKSEPRRIPIA